MTCGMVISLCDKISSLLVSILFISSICVTLFLIVWIGYCCVVTSLCCIISSLCFVDRVDYWVDISLCVWIFQYIIWILHIYFAVVLLYAIQYFII